MKSWLSIPSDTDFTMYNFPFGIAKYKGNAEVVSRIGDQVIRTTVLAEQGVFDALNMDATCLKATRLNAFIEQGKAITVPFREALIVYFSESNTDRNEACLVPADEVEMLLPVQIGDYTDFFSSKEHATNTGSMFRDPENALLPNWRHLPVGYHGRASSIIVSGTDIRRPKGQQKPADAAPVYGPCKWLDFELEMGFIVGKSTELGTSVSTDEAEDHIFGLALFNDWSARDIQKWEYIPLGPFLGKNFASTLAPWIITLEALEPFRVPCPKQEPEVLPYLKSTGDNNYDVQLFVDIVTPDGHVNTISHSNYKFMYWNMQQQLAHHTVNGCNIQVGDLYASGTISGQDAQSYGSMLEISWQGKRPITLADGTERKFIHDGDTVRLRGRCEKDGISLGFGPCDGKILPAN